MTDRTDMYNAALQEIGSRTTLTAAQISGATNNEAKQLNISYTRIRNRLLRMAPWNCAFNTANLTYITSVPGTPENTSPATSLWAKGQPAPPWAYEYQYPVDCLRACWVTPNTATGFAGGIPITTAVTGGAPSFWQGPPVKFVVGVDQFYGVTAAAVAAGGTGYAVGDTITLAQAAQGSAPLGAPVQLVVLTAPAGVVATVSVVNVINGEASSIGGSYFLKQTNPVAQGSTSGSGTGATFNLTQQATQSDQRVILTNQEFAILNYVKVITDENLFDDAFQLGFAKLLGAQVAMALTGDKTLANMKIGEANSVITSARGDDANEGLRVNDVMPDWIRVRGVAYTDGYSGPYNTGFDWGALWPGYT